jgi:hypothetical protein
MRKILISLFWLIAPLSCFAQISGQVTSLPGVPAGVSIVQTGSPQNRADSTAGIQLADREGNTKIALGHAEITEATRRGRVYTTANNAYTIVAQNASAGNIGTAKPIVGFYNPLGSGVNAVLINEEEWHTSGTPGGPLIFNYFCGQTWVSVSSGTIYNNLLSASAASGSAMIPQNNQNLTANPAITTAMNALAPAGGPETTVLTTSSGLAGHTKDLKGQIVVPPGCAFGLFATGTGTSDIVSASLTWEEITP